MKRLKFIIIFMMIMITMVGCKNKYADNSPEGVALEMAERLSEGNYKDVADIIYSDGAFFLDENTFENYLNSNSLNIVGNEKIEVEETENSIEDIETKTVKIRLDDNKILKVNTIKKDEKWYVDLSNDFKDTLTIKVPSDSKVKLNNKIVDYGTFGKTEEVLKQVGSYQYNEKMDIYTIPNLLEGKYILSIDNELMTSVEEEINSNKSSYYDEKGLFGKSSKDYTLFGKVESTIYNETKTFLETYYKDAMEAATNEKEFSEISKYFVTDTNEYKNFETSYNSFKKGFKSTIYSTWVDYCSDLKAEFNMEDKKYGVNYVSKNNFIIYANVKMTYVSTRKYNNPNKVDEVENLSVEKDIMLDVIRNEDGTYKIQNGDKVIPSFSKYN